MIPAGCTCDYARGDGGTLVLVAVTACPYHGQGHPALASITSQLEEIMSALTDLQAADTALKAEVATFLADIATALGAEDPDIESVVSDINAQVAALQAADPETPAAPAAPAEPAPPVA